MSPNVSDVTEKWLRLPLPPFILQILRTLHCNKCRRKVETTCGVLLNATVNGNRVSAFEINRIPAAAGRLRRRAPIADCVEDDLPICPLHTMSLHASDQHQPHT